LQELYPKNEQKLKAVKIKFFARQIPVFDAPLKPALKTHFLHCSSQRFHFCAKVE